MDAVPTNYDDYSHLYVHDFSTGFNASLQLKDAPVQINEHLVEILQHLFRDLCHLTLHL
jgi:hypothetical protein